ncbi:MAG: ArsR family transcriptional regulator [bacterium]
MQLIGSEPGINKTTLCRELGLGWGTVSHHLRVLTRRGLVAAYGRGKEVHWFPCSVDEAQYRWLCVLHDGRAASIVNHLERRPGLRLSDLSDSIGISRKVIRRHLSQLGEEGLVTHEGETQRRYRLQRPLLPAGPDDVSHRQ